MREKKPPAGGRAVEVVEVGPRDGLQNEARRLSTSDKVRFVEGLVRAGFRRLEVASFVRPDWVPQMADAGELYARLPQVEGVSFSALVPNERGLEAALKAGVREIAVFTAASETFNRRNVNVGLEGSFAAIAQVLKVARQEKIRARGYLSTCFGCPYEGFIPVERVAQLTQRLLELGCCEVSVSDTIGVATPGEVARVLEAVLASAPVERIALHFHDTRGQALANVVRALEYGVRVFDSAAGGAGGCPFAPGAAGNVASEDLVYLLEGLGMDAGVSLPELMATSRWLEGALDRTLPSRVLHSPYPPPGRDAKNQRR